jgi:inner membrane protein involved in colicin E2 resistance
MDPKHLHDTRKKLNDLAISHNRLTTLTACLLNELQGLKKEMNEMKGIKTVQTPSSNHSSLPIPPNSQIPQAHRGRAQQQQQQQQNFRYDMNNIASLQADEILKQLTIHN